MGTRVLIAPYHIRRWLSQQLSVTRSQESTVPAPGGRRTTLALICAVIFTLALGVRLLEWQDRDIEIEGTGPLHLLDRMAQHYHREARRMISQGRFLFSYPDDPGDAHPVLHPPGYSILLAALYGSAEPSGSRPYRLLRLLQVICDAGAAVFAFLIVRELLPVGLAAITGCLVALSPQLAFYSLWLTPEPVSSFVIIIAVYLMVSVITGTGPGKARPAAVLMFGMMLGLSCWLRSINLLLGPFLCVVAALLIERGKRLRYWIAALATAAVLIIPITVRNWTAYHHFIPLSIGSGITLVEGIAEYDTQGRFGLPRIDDEAKVKDVEWYGRPDYGRSPWVPDGVERDRGRLARGLAVVRSNPLWFAGIMFRRARSMLRYNDTAEEGWPSDSAKVPVIEREPPVGHLAAGGEAARPVWRSTAEELISGGRITSSQAEVFFAPEGSAVRILGDNSEFGEQFVSGPIAVRRYTDYALTVHGTFEQGAVALKVTSADERTTLASAFKPTSERGISGGEGEASQDIVTGSDPQPRDLIEMRFATGGRSDVRLVVSNNGTASSRPAVRLGDAQLAELGPTLQVWSRHVRPIARSIQRRLYTTSTMLILVFLGAFLLGAAGHLRALLILVAVPVYYLCTQSALHTEYRYTLPIHYFLFGLAAVTLYSASAVLWFGALRLKKLLGRSSRGRTVI